MSESNVLKLQLDIANNQISSFNGLQEEIKWTADQGKYTVELIADESIVFDNIFFIISDSKMKPKEMFSLSKTEEGWKGNSALAEEIKGDTKINIGVQYSIKQTFFSTTPLEVKIKQSITSNNNLTIDDLPEDFSKVIEILNKFENAKAIESLITKKYSAMQNSAIHPDGTEVPNISQGKDPYCLYVKYQDDDKYTYMGIASLSVEELGLVEPAIDTDGGGGTVGLSARLGYVSANGGKKRGFAGGRSAIANDGAAVGCEAQAKDGLAGGGYAKASKTNIALGYDAQALGKQYSVVSIGTSTRVEGSNNTIVIGKRNEVKNSPYGVIIGSYTKKTEEGSNGEIIYDEGVETLVENSRYPIVIGTSAKLKNINEAILIGNNIKAEPLTYSGGATPQCKENIVIGYSSVADERGCIAIGANVYAGCYKDDDGKIQPGFDAPSSTEPAAIAVGRHSKAVGHASIAIGKSALATRFNSIAIGQDAEAGPVLTNFTRASAYNADNDDGRSAVAIGYAAKAKAPGAVQLGKGTNSTANSLKFRNVTVVQDGAVQFDLSGKGAQNTLPVSKGGTGGTTKATARHGIGIFTGGKTFTEPLSDFSGSKNTGKDITINYANYKFKSPPKLFFNLRFAKDNTSPVLFNYYVKEITATKVTLRVDYWKQDWDTSKKNSKLTFGFDVLAIGDGVKP